MKARKLIKRNEIKALGDLPMPANYVEVFGNFEIQRGDQIFILNNDNKTWYYYTTAYGFAGNNSRSLAQSINNNPNNVRYARIR